MKVRKLTSLLLFAVFMISIAGCSYTVNFQKSKVVPAAEVDMQIERDLNNNYKIEITVTNLAHPQDLTPARNTFVAWVESKYGNFNIGQLAINKNLKGKLIALTPYEPSRIKITAEDNAEVTTAGQQVVLISEPVAMN